jgi:DNA polymerase (family 10)
MTERFLRAIQSGVVKAVGHPLGRMFGQRPEMDLDLERVFQACAEQGVALEINCSPSRLDLPDRYCKQAAEAGVKMSIATDAHRVEEFDLLRYGILTARRGWLTAGDIINTGNTGDIL